MKITLIKALRDLKLYKGRTLLMLLGILIGISSAGAVLSAYSILDREMQKNFMDTNPASFIFSVPNLDERAEGLIREKWPDSDTDMKATVQARISRGDGTYGTIFLKAVRGFDHQAVDTCTLEKGRYPSGTSEMALERDCLKILPGLKTGAGETVRIMLPGGEEKEVSIAGTVHAAGLAPASMENFSYGFVTMGMLRSLGYKGGYDELRVVSHVNRMDRSAMKEMAQEARTLLEKNGYTVKRIDVPVPGKHPHADQLSSLLFLLQAFAVISLFGACLIIVNLLNFVMSRQRKQIAIQKAVGGSTRQIAAPYFLYILIVSLIAVILSIPLSLAGGAAYSDFAASILNFDISSYAQPSWVFAVQVLAGLLIPLAAAAWPVFKSCAVSVRDGLSEKVSGSKRKKAGRPDRKSASNIGLAMPLRNLMRKKARTALAVLALVAGGVLFMTAQNMIVSIDGTTNGAMDALKWDYDIRLNGTYAKDVLYNVTGGIGGLKLAEVWQSSTGFFKGEGDSANYPVKVVPSHSALADLPAMDSGGNTVIINQAVGDAEKWITPGKTVTLQIGGKAAEVKVGPVVTELPPMPAVYISEETYARLFGGAARQIVYASANTRDYSAQRSITKDIEEKFKAAGIGLAENWNVYVLRKAFADHLKVIITFLSVMALLAVAVGGLGIGSTIGINISERRYETGVQRAIGAKPRRIYGMILAEVLMMGLFGWLAGAILSYPVSAAVGDYFGYIFLHTGLNNVFSWTGAVVWLVISAAAALISGYIPARKAANAPLRDMLSYE